MNAPDFDAAATFIAANARVVDRRRFQRMFGDGAAEPVRDAVTAYRNDDGGWSRIGALTEPSGYDMFGVLRFLQHVPDRDRAGEAFGRVGPLIIERKLVTLDPQAPGEVHFPLDFAPEPDSLARGLFDDATIKAHVDHLAQAQRDDGGWTFNWPAWSPAAEREWRLPHRRRPARATGQRPLVAAAGRPGHPGSGTTAVV
jgi:hypothetical protein